MSLENIITKTTLVNLVREVSRPYAQSFTAQAAGLVARCREQQLNPLLVRDFYLESGSPLHDDLANIANAFHDHAKKNDPKFHDREFRIGKITGSDFKEVWDGIFEVVEILSPISPEVLTHILDYLFPYYQGLKETQNPDEVEEAFLRQVKEMAESGRLVEKERVISDPDSYGSYV